MEWTEKDRYHAESNCGNYTISKCMVNSHHKYSLWKKDIVIEVNPWGIEKPVERWVYQNTYDDIEHAKALAIRCELNKRGN